ncbi:ZIP Zinc transporter family protein [Brugia malayi]|uniref:Zinc transporter ZIP11 n=1 Tax=Brugia malayi TaxID=6279 RepID=A0A0I9N4G0_BRUMA|nr:ZIP Zinc transporter family protein [Brugia malayi]CTP80998.1 Bm4578 [Brugia malayi]VIO97249.1 ZIP Zinc transporter family protein [Brugia malayi]
MIRGWNTIPQAFVASLFTWGVTALGAAVVFFIPPSSKKLLDISLGFAAGIMIAASFWSLLAPAIELSETEMGSFAFLPVAVGFAGGAAFVYIADRIMPSCVLSEISVVDLLKEDVTVVDPKEVKSLDAIVEENISMVKLKETNDNIARIHQTNDSTATTNNTDGSTSDATATVAVMENGNRAVDKEQAFITSISWRRILLLIIAVTVHNIPEGLAVGVAFGSIGKTSKATFESAFALALGIGLQNFPEGLAVSLPLAAFGHTKMKSFFYGQLSGMVEPLGALAGSAAVILMEPVLPYALSFAAGAMIYVVLDDIIPEAQRNGNGRLASISSVIGFLIMMALDVGLG